MEARCFQRYFPAFGPDPRQPTFKPTLIQINHSKVFGICHVLIIEDEMLVAMDLQAVLMEAGATSFAFASSEAEAVDMAAARLPLIITSDVRLTIGTGPAAVRIIRDRLGMIPVLFICGTPADCNPREPDDAVYQKPFDRTEIASAFRQILSGCDQPAGLMTH